MRRTAGGSDRGAPARTRVRASSRLARFTTVTAVILFTVTAGARLLRQTPGELIIEPELLTRIQTLAQGLHQEIVLCLQGRVRGDRAIVDDFVMPVPRLSTPTRSSFERCPRGTLASWHNHPPNMPTTTPMRPGGIGDRARSLCVLSETDIRTAERLRHPFVVVSVDATTWCWWGLNEVDQFAAQSISPAPPSPERIARADGTAAWARPSIGPAPQ